MAGQYIEAVLSFALPPLRACLQRLPGACAVCAAWAPGRFCAACLARFAGPCPRCPRCADPSPGGRVCGACLHNPPACLRTYAALDYHYPWDRLITRFKFHGGDDLAAPLASLLQAALVAAGTATVDLIVPVPLALPRLRERGFNQAWELARRLQRGPARAEVRLLQRRFDTPHQTGLARSERVANLQGAFSLDPRRAPTLAGRSVALVDDVMTTGATIDEAARTLLAGGARSVVAWVLARTPSR